MTGFGRSAPLEYRQQSTHCGHPGCSKADVWGHPIRYLPARTQRHVRLQLVEQRFRFLQVFRIEALGEPVVDRREQSVAFLALTMPLPQPCPTGRCAQLPRLRLLLARPVERGEVILLGACDLALEREHPAL